MALGPERPTGVRRCGYAAAAWLAGLGCAVLIGWAAKAWSDHAARAETSDVFPGLGEAIVAVVAAYVALLIVSLVVALRLRLGRVYDLVTPLLVTAILYLSISSELGVTGWAPGFAAPIATAVATDRRPSWRGAVTVVLALLLGLVVSIVAGER